MFCRVLQTTAKMVTVHAEANQTSAALTQIQLGKNLTAVHAQKVYVVSVLMI